MSKQKLGLTLTSIMVAVGLSGVLAVAAVRLAVNQMNALQVMELIDKGDAIYKFYSNLMHDDKVWWCTLFDKIEEPTPSHPNMDMRNCLFGAGGCGGGGGIFLKGPDCKFNEPIVGGKVMHRFKTSGAYDFTKEYGTDRQYQSSAVDFIPDGGKYLKESVMQPAGSGGWWNVKVEWEHVNNNAVDLVFTQSFDADNWRNAPSAGKRHLPELNYPRELRVRRSTNFLSGTGCGARAVVDIKLHTHGRTVDCGERLVHTTGSLSSCPTGGGKKGAVVESTTQCSHASNRVSVTPTDCGACSSVIWQIGSGSATPDQNVRCALEGLGKMIDYGGPAGTGDDCGAHFIVPTNQHLAITHISSRGERQYATLMGWPASQDYIRAKLTADGQGPVGWPGCDGWGPRGPPAPDCPTYGTSYGFRNPISAPTCPNPPPRPDPRKPVGKCP